MGVAHIINIVSWIQSLWHYTVHFFTILWRAGVFISVCDSSLIQQLEYAVEELYKALEIKEVK